MLVLFHWQIGESDRAGPRPVRALARPARAPSREKLPQVAAIQSPVVDRLLDEVRQVHVVDLEMQDNQVGLDAKDLGPQEFALHGGVVARHGEIHDLERGTAGEPVQDLFQCIGIAIFLPDLPAERTRIAKHGNPDRLGRCVCRELVVAKTPGIDSHRKTPPLDIQVGNEFVDQPRILAGHNNVAESDFASFELTAAGLEISQCDRRAPALDYPKADLCGKQAEKGRDQRQKEIAPKLGRGPGRVCLGRRILHRKSGAICPQVQRQPARHFTRPIGRFCWRMNCCHHEDPLADNRQVGYPWARLGVNRNVTLRLAAPAERRGGEVLP